MGQKVNPTVYRLPLMTTHTWQSKWFAMKPAKYQQYMLEDVRLRKALMKKYQSAGICKVELERSARSIKVILWVTRPGIVIGRGGVGIEELRTFIFKTLGVSLQDKNAPKIDPKIEEVKSPDLSAHLVAMRICEQLAKRMPSRRVAVKAIEKSMSSGAKGIKIVLSGRINGAEIARKEPYQQGSVPLQTLRANVDYASMPALTRSGYVGVKVWIYKPTENK